MSLELTSQAPWQNLAPQARVAAANPVTHPWSTTAVPLFALAVVGSLCIMLSGGLGWMSAGLSLLLLAAAAAFVAWSSARIESVLRQARIANDESWQKNTPTVSRFAVAGSISSVQKCCRYGVGRSTRRALTPRNR